MIALLSGTRARQVTITGFMEIHPEYSLYGRTGARGS